MCSTYSTLIRSGPQTNTAMVLAAFMVPQGAPLLGMDLTARFWNALRLTAPFLSQVGDVVAGAVGGLVVGGLQALS